MQKIILSFCYILILLKSLNGSSNEKIFTKVEKLLTNPKFWIPPISIWSQLKFPVMPEQVLENRNAGIVPEPFDATKLNTTVGNDGYVVGQKFCQCGRSPWRQTRFLETEPFKNDVPWTATLILNKFRNVFCGGALLNDRIVITAAHCLLKMKPSDIAVHIAEDDFLPSSSTIYQTHKFEVDEIRIHPKYNPKTIEHDVGLLILREPIDFFEIPISPVCLPVRIEDYVNLKGTVTEWVSVLDSRGRNSSDSLQKATLDIISTAQCNRFEDYRGLISDNHICTKSCQGDHGGQLLVERNGRMLLAGVGSWGLDCRGTDAPSVFTRVPKYAAWILRNSDTAEWCIE